MINLGIPCGQRDLEILNGGIPHADVVGDGILKDHNVLIHHRQRPGEFFPADASHGLTVEKDLAAPGLIQPGY